MIVLGIDPGTAALGYGVISRNGGLRAVDYGVLSTGADLPLPERLLAVHTLMTDLIELHAPSLIGVERLFFSRNAQTAFAVHPLRSIVFGVLAFGLAAVSGVLLILAIGATREMWRDPPATGHEILPADYKVPYSHLHRSTLFGRRECSQWDLGRCAS